MKGPLGTEGGVTFCGGVLLPPPDFPILASLSNFGGSLITGFGLSAVLYRK